MKENSYRELKELLEQFSSISLEQLKESRRLFQRIDTKFVIDYSTLLKVLWATSGVYDALDINNKKIFVYDTIYLDTPDFYFYNQHIDGVPLRTKVRTRHYLDAGLVYFEVKQKSNEITNKYRIRLDETFHGKMNEQAREFYKKLFFEAYGFYPDHKLVPQTKTIYKRITLSHKLLPEKVTIDLNLTFDESHHKIKTFEELVVVEVKSETKESFMSKLLKKYGYKQRKECSKYGLSLCYLDMTQQKDYFSKTIQMINSIEAMKTTYSIIDAIEENAGREYTLARQKYDISSCHI